MAPVFSKPAVASTNSYSWLNLGIHAKAHLTAIRGEDGSDDDNQEDYGDFGIERTSCDEEDYMSDYEENNHSLDIAMRRAGVIWSDNEEGGGEEEEKQGELEEQVDSMSASGRTASTMSALTQVTFSLNGGATREGARAKRIQKPPMKKASTTSSICDTSISGQSSQGGSRISLCDTCTTGSYSMADQRDYVPIETINSVVHRYCCQKSASCRFVVTKRAVTIVRHFSWLNRLDWV
jgi:hypothetical protein